MIQRRAILHGAGLCALTGLRPGGALAAAESAPAGPYAWHSVPFGAGGFIDGFVFHPAVRGLLYARTDIGGAYRFEPTTSSWAPLLDHLPRADADLSGVLSLAVDPNAPDRLYAACGLYLGSQARDGALLASDDRGATWRQYELGVKIGGNSGGRGTGERLQVDPHLGDVLLLGTSQDGLMRSADRGASFERLAAFAPRHVSLVLIDARGGRPGQASPSIYAGSHDQPGLWVSHDGGASFAREPGAPAQVPQHAAFGPDGTLYVAFSIGDPAEPINPGNAHDGSVWKRGRDSRWADITPLRPVAGTRGFGYSGLDVDRQVPGRLVVSTIERWEDGDELFMSTDDGAHWTPLRAHSRHDASTHPWLVNYLHGVDAMGHWIADVKLDPFDGQRALYGTGFGLWMTNELGAAQQGRDVPWRFEVANLEETATLEIRSPSGGATLLGAMGDVSGGAWDDLSRGPSTGLFAPCGETNRSVDFAQARPAILARTADHAPTGGYVSTDGGVTWQPFGPSSRATRTPQGHWVESGRIAVSAGGAAFLWVPDRQPALWSKDLGRSWHLSSGWPETRDVALVPVADRGVEGVFYVHDRAHGQILVSVDGGASFNQCVDGLPRLQSRQTAQLVAAPGAVRDLWVALPDGLVHVTGEEGKSRQIAPVAEAWMVALGKGAPGASYHSVYVWGRVKASGVVSEGLFRSDDLGRNFVRVNDDRHRFGLLLSMAADPLEYGTLYIAPHGRGVMVGKPRKAA